MRHPPNDFSPAPGATIPGQLGPKRRVVLPAIARFTRTMSLIGIP